MYVICMKARPAYAGLKGDEGPDSPHRFEHAGIIYIYNLFKTFYMYMCMYQPRF